MAKVPLRKYTSEIEALIDRGQTDEAIAHCRHILKTFPKHLETYRLLGKAYLESRRYAEATDIFERVLMAAPDDFVSHVGVSIIADDQKRLDDAIWHMERAFEKQPSNAAIQAELQRLYGRRDGMEPPKIRLTRGALAHMYVQGELHTQAIAEVRSVLTEEPNRTDMQALLALACFRGGQKVDASETCSQLLDRFPYCLDANRILVEILPGTGMAENAHIYRQRVIELDPYAAFASGSIFLTSETPETAVSLERLDYKGQAVDAPPAWGNALGVASTTAAQPDWMKSEIKKEPAAPFAQSLDSPQSEPPVQQYPFDESTDSSTPESDVPASAGSEPIPEWMRQAGWGESSGVFDESATSLTDDASDSEILKADLPDWIKSMAPAESEPRSQATPAPASSTADDTMDWLNRLGGDKPFAELAEETPSASAAAPDWLSDFNKPAQETPVTPTTSDWLSDLKNQTSPAVVSPMESAAPAPVSFDSSLGNLGTSAAEQDAAMLWLEGLAAKQGAKSEELITNPEERLDKPPEWVEQAKAVGESQPVEVPPASESIPFGEVEPPPHDAFLASNMMAVDRTGIWLRELDEKDEQPETPVEKEPTSWSGEMEFTPLPPAEPVVDSALEADLPTWLRSHEARETASTASELDDMPGWLKGEERETPSLPEPTSPTDWAPESEKAGTQPAAVESSMELPKPEERKSEQKPASVALGDKSKGKRTDVMPSSIDPSLSSARAALLHGKIPDALQSYGNLIRKGKSLEDVTFDLKEALYRFPVEVSIWQALGDAYMRANRLQDALDAYTKAEELLR